MSRFTDQNAEGKYEMIHLNTEITLMESKKVQLTG